MFALSHLRWVLLFAVANASLAAFAKTNDTDNCTSANTVTADVVAIEQAYVINRFAAFVPGGMLYALRRDVVSMDGSTELKPGKVRLRSDKRPRPLVLRMHEGGCLDIKFQNLLDPGWNEEGGLPLEYDGKLPQHVESRAGATLTAPRELVKANKVSKDIPRTRAASIHVNGLEYAPIAPAQCPVGFVCGGNGSNVGLPSQQGKVFNPATPADVVASFKLGTLVTPGQRSMLRMTGVKEGTYFAYSTAAPVGGEGNGGQIGLGLFGAVNVEPAGSHWYRSQVTHETLQSVTGQQGSAKHPYAKVDYEAERNGVPVLAILNKQHEIVHSDLNAMIVQNEAMSKAACKLAESQGKGVFGDNCGQSFREFTVILHDEVHAEQAFAELADESNPLHYLKDGMGINYGVSSMGSLLVSAQPQRGVGVVAKCPECRAEEFFLSSWANGDPALILKWDKDGKKPVGAMYPDDPSNVHHSYLGDPVRFRNLHAGPKETHVFHLHAHQWVLDTTDPNSTYLDSQTISPGATFSYGIEFGGSGNRNYTPGDSIFHCHLYPHFAQGMWELWRVHDAFEDGTKGIFNPTTNPRGRSLPDAEVVDGTENPALVPIPGNALAPIATAQFPGYPFYVPGEAGHRPPQPPLDMDVNDPTYKAEADVEPDEAKIVNGGLRRHIITGKKVGADGKALLSTLRAPNGQGAINDPVVKEALAKGGEAAQVIAQRVYAQNKYSVEALARQWKEVYLKPLAHSGEASEKVAMKFHEGGLPDDSPSGARRTPVSNTSSPHPKWWEGAAAYRTEWAATTGLQQKRTADPLFHVNGRPRAAGAPYANPCPAYAPERQYRAAFIQTELTVNRHGWFDPQGRIVVLENDIKDIIDPATRLRLPEPLFFRANSGECINFKSSNFMPSALNVDDFQLFTPTDTIGQHIHLVKFDVTSSDGSGNGWNYEDATFSPDEVRERIFAHWRATGDKSWKPKAHPLFMPGGDIYKNKDLPQYSQLYEKGRCPEQTTGQSDEAYEHELNEKHPLCGAQRTTQRWWADPILNTVKGKDNTLRTVFTHDHMGPSSHQQHGLYAALVIEPANSTWLKLGDKLEAGDMANAGKPGPAGDAVRKKLLGGSDLSAPPSAEIMKTYPPSEKNKEHPLKAIAPRQPLRMIDGREDGGPTSSRANIISPSCIADPDSHPFQPASGRVAPPSNCTTGDAEQTRREFGIAIADFAGVYNTVLEPINPETRDVSARRFGERQVAYQIPRPLAISSEDPGTQLVNYRNEPLALRIADVKADSKIGGFNYSQTKCVAGDQACTGDMANGFASHAHEKRDLSLASTNYAAWSQVHNSAPGSATLKAYDLVSPVTRAALARVGKQASLTNVVNSLESWRRDFTCALYPRIAFDVACRDSIERNEPWRVMGDPATPILPAFEGDPVQIRLIQGSQEAQHIFTMNGVKWNRIAGSKGSGYTNAQPIGISEHFEFDIHVNPLGGSHTDYLYFGSSIDQLWDGMWGVLRAYGELDSQRKKQVSLPLGVAKLPDSKGVDRSLPGPSDTDASRQFCTANSDAWSKRVRFDVSAVRACDLYDSCDSKDKQGITYNQRYKFKDDHALVYVLNGIKNGTEPDDTWGKLTNKQILDRLRNQFQTQGRPLEPLVLRAAAGQCMETHLRNHLPPLLDDGPLMQADSSGNVLPENRAYFNFLPMITDGFNLNQFRMSSSVGLSAPRVAQHPLSGDGSNVGLNEKILSLNDSPNALKRQGSLVPPCLPDDLGTKNEVRCQRSYVWRASDFGQGNQPVELGALPLRSFGDVIKHPTHGLIGALVIGPEGSKVCTDSATASPWPAGLQTQICHPNGQKHLDQVLVMQDAVSATAGGFPIPDLSGAEEPDDYGVKAMNYRTEPLWARRGGDPSIGFSERNEQDYSQVFSSELLKPGSGAARCASGVPPSLARTNPCDPETPLIVARAGERVRLHFVHPGGHTRQQGLSLHGHSWNPYPWSKDSRVLDNQAGGSIRQGTYNGFGPMMGITLEVKAGGKYAMPMDYLLHSQASFLLDGGLWGILRVQSPNTKTTAIKE